MAITVFDKETFEVFGRGLTAEEAYQCVGENRLVINHEAEAELHRDDPGSDLRLLRTRQLAYIGDDYFEDYVANQF